MFVVAIYGCNKNDLIFAYTCVEKLSAKRYILNNFESISRIEDTEDYELFEISNEDYTKITAPVFPRPIECNCTKHAVIYKTEGDLIDTKNEILDLVEC